MLPLVASLWVSLAPVPPGPASAPRCDAAASRERVRDRGLDYERVRFTSSTIAADAPGFAWAGGERRVRFEGGTTIRSPDPALYRLWRYDPTFSHGLLQSGQSLIFKRISLGDRTIREIRLAASPGSAGAPDMGRRSLAPRPGNAPVIAGYEFQMAERLIAGSYLGLWRRTGSAGATTRLVYFRELPEGSGQFGAEIIGESDLSFSLISLADSLHGNWGFTLITEATCPQPLRMLNYAWYPRLPVDVLRSDARTAAHAGTRLAFRNVPFTGRRLDSGDPRFRIAAAGLNFRSGVRFVSRDPALYSMAWFDGSTSSGLLRDGQWLVMWPSLFDRPLVREVRVARTAEQAGQDRGSIGGRPAPSHPDIPGYSYVTSVGLAGSRDYLGIWRRLSGADQSLIVSFRPATDTYRGRYCRIGRLPLRLNSLIITMPMHNVSWDLTVTSEARVGRPIHVLHYEWMPGYYRPLSGMDPCDPNPE